LSAIDSVRSLSEARSGPPARQLRTDVGHPAGNLRLVHPGHAEVEQCARQGRDARLPSFS
jgi:hypothetical protein